MFNALGWGSLKPLYQELSPVTSLLLCPCMPLSPHSTPSLTLKVPILDKSLQVTLSLSPSSRRNLQQSQAHWQSQLRAGFTQSLLCISAMESFISPLHPLPFLSSLH